MTTSWAIFIAFMAVLSVVGLVLAFRLPPREGRKKRLF